MISHKKLIRYELVPQDDKNGTKGPSGPKKSKSSKVKSSNKIKFFILGGLALGSLIFVLYPGSWEKYYRHGVNILDTVGLAIGTRELVYSAVIDAGSTGSRILAYTFVSGSDKSLRLYNELFVEIKPGLSAFASQPSECRKSLEELIKRAKDVIPQDAWSRTPIEMKATAGLRLLPQDRADALLAEARSVLDNSGLLVGNDAVTIMDGVDEGVFSWFTVNFLLDRLGGDVKDTVAALDLGGGSTQISFAPADSSTIRPEDKPYMHRIAAFHRSLDIYTHSYLGLGLNEARKQILQVNNTKHSFVLKSECINPIVKEHKWKYGGIGYLINGPDNPEYAVSREFGEEIKTPIVRFDKCREVVSSILGHIAKPTEMNARDIYAFSYYYDRAADAGIIDFDKGGVVKLNDFTKAAKEKCKEPNADQPFLCLDLTFISVLLKDGFGLPDNKVINLKKRIDGHEISWALGAAFHLLQNGY